MTDGTAWYADATTSWSDWDPARLAESKGDQRVTVVLPARDEQATIGGIVHAIRTSLIERIPLVDELLVIDSDSTDDTAKIAEENGAVVHPAHSLRPDLGSHRGKGEALWKSQFIASGDILVFIDSDLTLWGPHFVTGLLGPLLTDPQVVLVKGFYDRLLDDGSGAPSTQGGRVTELVARPLLSLAWPALSSVVQPLAGEWAIRRRTFASLPVPVGYGVEMSTLVDVYAESGLSAIAQVDLGARGHSHQSVHDLGVMAAEIIAVAMRRWSQPVADLAALRQFDRDASPPWHTRPIPLTERPPAQTVDEATTGRHT
jgi:glucosyl-3-phosphoglycerate synthase